VHQRLTVSLRVIVEKGNAENMVRRKESTVIEVPLAKENRQKHEHSVEPSKNALTRELFVESDDLLLTFSHDWGR
jgi:hypothetical protein